MNPSLLDWHQRYTQQARWTASLRKYIFDQTGMNQASRVLEVGCGTGAILQEIEGVFKVAPFGVEVSFETAQFALSKTQQSSLTCADGHHLPFHDRSFEITLVHFVLLWVKDPVRVIQEMVRVTQPGGYILALAEPDYGGRLDYPVELSQVGKWQTRALQRQGADPFVGRRLISIFRQSGVTSLQAGVLGGQWDEHSLHTGAEGEWKVVLSDLETLDRPPDPAEVSHLKEIELTARQNGDRVLFVPTFYAWGKVP